jgi:pyruvate-ferredoxin/flavodoxin oxidoreductase
MTRHEKRGMAVQLPQWNPAKCMQCNECSLFCPHAAIRPFVLTPEEATGMETCDGKGKLAPNKFRIQVSALDCVACGVCANACRFGALHMAPTTPEYMEREAANWRRVEPQAGKHPRGAGLMPRQTVPGSQYYQPLLEFSGCCEGCGETPYIKAVTQLFGERMVITNAAGCSSVWGGTWGMIPYTTNADGHGPAWGNSLFEDNAEYGFGMARAHLQRRRYLHE